MKFLIPILAALSIGTATAGQPTPPPTKETVLLIQSTNKSDAAAPEIKKIVVPKGKSVADAMSDAAKDPNTKHIEVDKRVPLDGTPNDPSFPSQYHLSKINAPVGWDASTGTGVIIAILDSGVLATHPDLINNLVPGWNVWNNTNNTADVSRHGTAVAGVAAAVGNNALGIASVAYNARIMPIRVTDDLGYAYYSTVAAGLRWAADNGAKVANISVSSVASSAIVNDAAAYFKSKGGVVVMCAGNNGLLQNVAATSNNSIVVAATDANDVWQTYSNYGNHISVAAPGQGILTTNREGGYSAWSKTSFSSPQVAGLAALLFSVNPALTPDEVQNIIQTSAVDLGTPGKDIYYGYGRINVGAALKLASSINVPTPDRTPPVVTITPTSGTITGMTNITVTATDDKGVESVNLAVNGTMYGTLLSPPYVFSVDTRTLTNGTGVVKAIAIDTSGNVGESAPINVSIFNDKTPPVITVVSPVDNSPITNKSAITLYSTATDDSGATGITQTLTIDNVVRKTVTGSTLSFRWYLSSVPAGTHVVTFTAKDAAGNMSFSTLRLVK